MSVMLHTTRWTMTALVLVAAGSVYPSAQSQDLNAAMSEARPCREAHRTLSHDPGDGFAVTRAELYRCESHSYSFPLEAGQYVRFAVRLHGIDATLAAFAPDGTLLHKVTEPSIIEGKKSVWFVTKGTGTYRIEVRAAGDIASGHYDLVLQRRCEATAANRDFMRIDQGINEGLELQEAGTEAALRKAIPLLTEIASLAEKNENWPEDIFTGTPDWYRGTPLMYLGEIYLSLGEYDNALAAFQRTLTVRNWGDRGWTFKQIGDVYNTLGDKQHALEYYSRSLPAFEMTYVQSSSQRGPAIAKAAIGGMYASLGDHALALSFLDQSLRHWRNDNELRGEASTLMQISEVYVRLERYGDALRHYDQALSVFRSTSDHLREGRALCAVARVRITLGDYETALTALEQAIGAARRAGDRLGQADAHAELGRIHNLRANNATAQEYLHQALEVYRSLRVVQGEAGCLFLIARAERDSGNLFEARKHIEAAIEGIEVTRTGLIEDTLRASYLGTVRDYYDFHVDLLMRMHGARPGEEFELEALRISEQARARSLMDSLGAALNQVSGASPVLVERRRSLWQRINALIEFRRRVNTDLGLAWWKELSRLRYEYEQVEEQVRAANKRYASLTRPRTLSANEIRKELDDETLLLEYSLGDESSYLWAVTRDRIVTYPLPKRVEIERSARRVYELLTARNSRPKGETQDQSSARVTLADSQFNDAAAELSRMVLGPVAAELGTKRLVIVAEGALQYIPFSALPAPSSAARAYHPLIMEHEVVTLPSASVLTLLREEQLRRQPARGGVAVLADPVFTKDDPRLLARYRRRAKGMVAGSPSSPQIKSDVERALDDLNEAVTSASLPRLVSTRWEAEQITRAGPNLRALDFDASRETALSEALKRYRVVHFASHAIIDEIHPELSGLVLSMVDRRGRARNGYLRAEDVYNMKLNADLVVLSACRTGLGKDVRGEGLIGLTRGFMYAGAPRVVVSLWKVNDQATADLMAKFYRQMFPAREGKAGMAKAAALRLAQLEMLRSRRWAAPYFWAGFTLQGEWR